MAAKAATQATIHKTMGASAKRQQFQYLGAIVLMLAWVAAFAAMTMF
jgi:hypothetical protein